MQGKSPLADGFFLLFVTCFIVSFIYLTSLALFCRFARENKHVSQPSDDCLETDLEAGHVTPVQVFAPKLKHGPSGEALEQCSKPLL